MILRWPLREMLVRYLAWAQELTFKNTLEAYRHTQLLWQLRHVFGGSDPNDPPPQMPEELKR